jgi:hypothetical protein
MRRDLCAPLSTSMDEATIEERPGVRLMLKDSAEAIAREVQRRGVTWAWVEGFSHAGKSVFAGKLALALGWQPAINLDHMTLETDGQPASSRYGDHLDLERLRAVVDSGRTLVVEGVSLRHIVDGMRPQPAMCIYIARVSRAAPGQLIWHDGVKMQEPESVRDNWLVHEVIDYHRRLRPHATSDFVLVRVENDPLPSPDD